MALALTVACSGGEEWGSMRKFWKFILTLCTVLWAGLVAATSISPATAADNLASWGHALHPIAAVALGAVNVMSSISLAVFHNTQSNYLVSAVAIGGLLILALLVMVARKETRRHEYKILVKKRWRDPAQR